MNLLDKRLYDFVMILQKSSLGRVIVRVLYGMGLARIWNFILLEKYRRNPTLEMKEAAEFYKNSSVRIQNVCAMLVDDISRSTLRRCIKFRCTQSYKDRPHYNTKNQYFPEDIMKLDQNEVFVDCGAYNGDTLKAFQKAAHNRYARLIAFEPDKENMRVYKENNRGYCCYPCGCMVL